VKKSILIVEDESDIADALAARLRNENFSVTVADNGIDGLDLALEDHYDLAVLDIMLPGRDGLDLAQELKKHKNTPILVLSARDDEDDVISGFSIGADDYVTKPFSTREVVARIHAILRRTDSTPDVKSSRSYTFGELEVDGNKHKITLKNEDVHTTPTEFRLVYTMCQKPGIVFTREELVALLSHGSQELDENNDGIQTNIRTVDSHIRSLRKKIGPEYIRTVHAVGYSFEPEPKKSKASA